VNQESRSVGDSLVDRDPLVDRHSLVEHVLRQELLDRGVENSSLPGILHRLGLLRGGCLLLPVAVVLVCCWRKKDKRKRQSQDGKKTGRKNRQLKMILSKNLICNKWTSILQGFKKGIFEKYTGHFFTTYAGKKYITHYL